MNLRGAKLSERSQSQKISCWMIASLMTYLKQQNDGEEKQSRCCQRLGVQGVGGEEVGQDHKRTAQARFWEWWNCDICWLWWQLLKTIHVLKFIELYTHTYTYTHAHTINKQKKHKSGEWPWKWPLLIKSWSQMQWQSMNRVVPLYVCLSHKPTTATSKKISGVHQQSCQEE